MTELKLAEKHHERNDMNHNVRKRTFIHVRQAKNQIRLRIRAVWSESSLGAFWLAKDVKYLYEDYEDSEQTAQKRRMICVFVGRTYQTVRFLTFRIISRHADISLTGLDWLGNYSFV